MLGMPLKKNEVFGIIEGKTLKKKLLNKHLLQKPRPAICVDAELMKQAISDGVETLVFELLESDKTYKISVHYFLSKCFSVNRGYGQQLGIRIADLEKVKNTCQLSLFENAVS